MWVTSHIEILYRCGKAVFMADFVRFNTKLPQAL